METKGAKKAKGKNKSFIATHLPDAEEQLKLIARLQEKNDFWYNESFWNFYNAKSCIVCHTSSRVETCNRCKMISYCGEKHRKFHWPEHKDLCKVILGMLNETGATTLFDNSKACHGESWLRIKIALLLKAQSKLGRPLLNYEREMFLFPKTCFVCHESDLSIVRPCDCGVYLCKQHKKDERHVKLCYKFQIAFLLAVEMRDIKPYPTLKFEIEEIINPEESLKTIPVHTEMENLPKSMKKFLQTYMKLSGQAAREAEARTRHRTQIVSEFISRPLTLFFALQKLNLLSFSTLTIHVIGATHHEFDVPEYWEIILHLIPALKNLEIIFIGPELTETCGTFITVCNSCRLNKNIESDAKAETYEEYFYKKIPQRAGYHKPDVVIGFHLDLHEIELGITEWTWKDGISVLKKVNVPFIMTAGSEERAKKDHEMLGKLLEKPVSYLFSEPNPFAGLIPERDFETEELKYTNGHILIYESFYEESTEPELSLTQLEQDSLEDKQVTSKTKLEELEKKLKAQMRRVTALQSQRGQRFIKQACTTVVSLKKQVELLEIQKSKKQEDNTVGELEKQFEAEEIQKSEKQADITPEKDSQFEEKQTDITASELKKVQECKDIRDPDVFEFKGKAHVSRETSNSVPETSSIVENPKPLEQDLLQENLMLKEENRILKENCLLKEVNRQLVSENKKLKQENERLQAENQLLKDIRSQVKESIIEAMSEKQFS